MPSRFTGDDHDRQSIGRSRRTFLLGVGAAVALTGCLADDGDSDTSESSDEAAGDTATPDPDTDTATPGADDGGDGDDSGQGLSRAEARELLPLESLAFRYEPALGRSLNELWVAVVGEADAAAVRAEAESGTYNEVGPRDGTIDGYLGVPVQVDPDGDAVTVFAVAEDGTRGRVASITVPTDDLSAEAARQAIPADALSFTYEPPSVGEFGSLTVEVTADTDAETLVAQPQEAPGTFADRVGDIRDDEQIEAGTTLEVAVDPDGDEVIVSATVDGATGEVTRWQGPD